MILQMKREGRFQNVSSVSDLRMCTSIESNGIEEAEEMGQFSVGWATQTHSFSWYSLIEDVWAHDCCKHF